LSETYIFDACSLIALLTNEKGSEIVKDLLQRAIEGKIKIVMHKINLLEVYYDAYKTYNEEKALRLLEYIKICPIKINSEVTDDMITKAGRLKATYKMSLADSIGLAETIINDGYFVTADYREMEIVEQKEKVKIIWIREKKQKT
jgi:PIN domain nuclease of toxin-antitoxin system